MQKRATGEYVQAEIMGSQIMAETLEFQAAAIWKQESQLWQNTKLGDFKTILDLGCGTGQISSRLAAMDARKAILGIDLVPGHIAFARKQFGHLSNLSFEVGDGSALDYPDGSFDVALNRHVIQAVPEPEKLLWEMWRLIKPGGVLYVLAEDYGMIHASDTVTDRNWLEIADSLLDQGTDLLIGRKMPHILQNMGLPKPEMHILHVSTSNTDRAHLAGIMRTWRDGYTEFLATHTPLSLAAVEDHFARLIQCCEDPSQDLIWHVPIITVAKPA